MNQEWLWVTIGFIGQALFSARFIIQWLASERAKRSIVPVTFWFFSLGGGATLLAYAIYRRDPVFIAGQGAGLIIYVRNLMLIRRENRQESSPVSASNTPSNRPSHSPSHSPSQSPSSNASNSSSNS